MLYEVITPGAQGEGEVLDGVDAAEDLAQVLHLQEAHVRALRSRSRVGSSPLGMKIMVTMRMAPKIIIV